MLNSDSIQFVTLKGLTASECVEKVRAMYGDAFDCFPLDRQKIKIGGFLGIGAKEGIQIKFSLSPKKSAFNPSVTNPFASGMINQNMSDNSGYINPYASMSQPRESFEQAKQRILEKTGGQTAQSNPQIKEVLEAVKSLQQGIDEIKNSEGVSEVHPSILKIEQMLDNNEFSVSYIKKILERLRKEFSLEELNNFEMVQSAVVKWIADSIQIKKAEYTARPQVIILVGPTGVGKTTTVAKIAASYVCPPGMNQRPKRVGIITVDSFRIAARQQIETYGSHMEVPVEAADNSEDLKKCLAMFSDGYDYILIDTIGYSPNDVQNIRKMKETLNVDHRAVATYLAMSASTKISDMRDIIKQYEIFDYESVIVTKIDETGRIGNVISALSEKNKSAVYVTTGQHVPRDFENATVLTFLNKLSDFKINEYTNLFEN